MLTIHLGAITNKQNEQTKNINKKTVMRYKGPHVIEHANESYYIINTQAHLLSLRFNSTRL